MIPGLPGSWDVVRHIITIVRAKTYKGSSSAVISPNCCTVRDTRHQPPCFGPQEKHTVRDVCQTLFLQKKTAKKKGFLRPVQNRAEKTPGKKMSQGKQDSANTSLVYHG